jgi:DNA modification methylase
MSAWTIVEGDCIEVMGTIEPGSARVVFADQPYNIGVDYGGELGVRLSRRPSVHVR